MAAMQAVAEDPTTASLVNTDRFIVLTFFISSFFSWVGGDWLALV